MTTSDPTTASPAEAFAALRAAIEAGGPVIDAVPDDQLGAPTPCAEWDVRAVINHMTAAATMFALAAAHGHVPDAEAEALSGDVLGDDFRGAWKDAMGKVLVAFERPGVLGSRMVLPFGEVTGIAALEMAAMEVGIHSADVAHATRQVASDDRPFATVLDLVQARMVETWRAPGVLDPEQPTPAGATTIERLLAFAGRRIH